MFYVLVLFYFLDFTYRTRRGDDFVRGSISFVGEVFSFFNYLYINIFIVFYVLLKMRVCLPFLMFFCQRCLHWVGGSFDLRFSQISDHTLKKRRTLEQNPASPHET